MATIDGTIKKSSIRTRYTKCGKPNCVRCPHGPYLYRVWREGKQVKSEYLGRAFAVVGDGQRADAWTERSKHPYRPGDKVRFLAHAHPYWITMRGHRPVVHEDRPIMRVITVGWGRFGRSQAVYPYVLLETAEGDAVLHPYDATMVGVDPKSRLDRRFPTALLEVVKV